MEISLSFQRLRYESTNEILCRWLSLLRCKVFVFEIWRKNEFGERIAEKELILAVVKPEAHFVKVSREMLRRDFMPRAHNAALKQGECRFHGVRVNVAVSVFPRVVNRLVLALLHGIKRPRVDSGFVGKNHFHMAADVRVDNLFHGLGLGILRPNQPKIAVALPDSDNNRNVALRTPPALLTCHVGFINLHGAVQLLRRYFQHGRTDAVAEVPRGLVADSQRPLNLASGHSLFGLAEQICRKKPLRQRKMSVVEDGSRRCAELVVAGI